jgi:hypothetical protein
LLTQRIQWLTSFCNLSPNATRVIEVLATREDWTPLGKLVDGLRLPAFQVAQLASPRSPLRDWGLVRLTLDPEPALKLNQRIWRFLHAEMVQINDLAVPSAMGEVRTAPMVVERAIIGRVVVGGLRQRARGELEGGMRGEVEGGSSR